MCVHWLMGQLSKGLELIWSNHPKKGKEEGEEMKEKGRIKLERRSRETKKEESHEKDHGTCQTLMSLNSFSPSLSFSPTYEYWEINEVI